MGMIKKEPIWTKNFISISMTQLMLFLVFYALLTTLPLYVINRLGGNGTDVGLIVTVMLISAIFIRLFSARILELMGMKRGLVVGVVLFALTTCVYIWMDDLVSLLILRFIHGISFGLVTTATGAIAANVVPRTRHGEGIGYFAMAANLAVVLGPFIGLTLLQFVSFQSLFIILSAITVIPVLFATIVQVPQVEKANRDVTKRKFSIDDLIETKALPISLIAALTSFAYASVISFVSVYSDSINLTEAASYFFLLYAVAMLISRPYVGKRFDQLGPNYVVIPGLLLFALGLVILSFAANAWILLLSAAIIGLGFGTLTPSFQTMAVQSTIPSRSGHATATFFTFFDTGIAIGSYVLGMLVSIVGFEILYIICAVLLICVIGIYLLVQFKQNKRETV